VGISDFQNAHLTDTDKLYILGLAKQINQSVNFIFRYKACCVAIALIFRCLILSGKGLEEGAAIYFP